MEDYKGKVRGPCVKRLRKSKSLEFLGWGSKNLIEFLQSLGRDTTNKISEYDVTETVRKYIREQNLAAHSPSQNKKRKTKTVACDYRLRLLFESQKINIIKIPDLVAKHYAENQEDVDSYYYSPEDDEQQMFSRSDKTGRQTKQVLQKPKGTFAKIVSDNVKLLYLRKSFVQELAKSPETFESRVMGTFVRIKNPCQLVQVTGVKEGNPSHGYLLEVTNYTYSLKDVLSSALSDDDFSQEECEELHQRMKNGFAKRLTVVDMEEKVRSLHEDLTKHWIARELVLLQKLINQASEKGWRREYPFDLLMNQKEQLRLLSEVPEVVAEELEPECVDDDGKIENDFMEPNPEASIEARQSDEEQQLSDSPVSSLQKTPENFKLCNGEEQPPWTASPGDEDLNEYVEEQPANGIIAQNKDFISEVEMIGLDNEAQAQPIPLEIIELSDDDDDGDNKNLDNQHYDPKKVVWFYEYPKGETQGPVSLNDLKRWSDDEYFVEFLDFKVWMRGESRKSAVSLTKLLTRVRT
ncbi:hypothetical protein EUTSA_v10003998mg [Eutrema salsugineum]|uniref:GYF domain-containing protein n=1 Tax=Eutrema salsugineum TaxID=72664 RepID=V4KWY8_EUTSA|nr:hypothetical protein EUTSA_v10003998mg [Eutrema salsugineum]